MEISMSTTETTTPFASLTSVDSETSREGLGNSSSNAGYIKAVEFLCQGILMPLVGSLGIVGNVLILVVLTRKAIVCPTNYFLAALAVSDTGFLIVQVPFQIFVHGTASSHAYTWFGAYYWITWYVLTYTFFTSTCWLTTAVVTERFLSLRYSVRPTLKRIKLIVVAIFITAILLNLSRCFDFEPSLDITLPKPAVGTQLMKTRAYLIARTALQFTLVTLLPVLLMVIFNGFLLRFLFAHRRRMSFHGPAAVSGFPMDVNRVGVSVFVVVLIFVVCYLPEVYHSVSLAVYGNKIYELTANVVVIYVCRVLSTVNSSVNFVVYVVVNRRFRSKLVATFAKHSACRFLGKHFTNLLTRDSFSSSGRKASYTTSTGNNSAAAPGKDIDEMVTVRATISNGPQDNGRSSSDDVDDEIKDASSCVLRVPPEEFEIHTNELNPVEN